MNRQRLTQTFILLSFLMQMLGWENYQCLCNSLLSFCVDCERIGRNRRREEKKKHRQNIIVTVDFTNPDVRTQRHAHQYAVTKASQIGNSFSQFRFNDHRGKVNVSDVAEASRYSLPASIFVLHDGTGDWVTCCLTRGRCTAGSDPKEKEEKNVAAFSSISSLQEDRRLGTQNQPPHICI